MIKGLGISIIYAAMLIAIGISVGQSAPWKWIVKRSLGEYGEQSTHPYEHQDRSNAPSVLNKASAPASSSQEEEAQENIDIQRKLAYFTRWLVVVGCMQAGTMIWQGWLLRGSINVSQKAARLAFEGLVLSQRPRLAIREVSLGPHFRLEEGERPNGSFKIVNLGGSPAMTVSIAARTYINKAQALPMLNPLSGTMSLSSVGIKPGDFATRDFFHGERVTEKEAAGIQNGEFKFFLLAEIIYTDAMGFQKTTRSARRYDTSAHRFFPVNDPDYEECP